jgi:Ankyrin repeats (3 copies)
LTNLKEESTVRKRKDKVYHSKTKEKPKKLKIIDDPFLEAQAMFSDLKLPAALKKIESELRDPEINALKDLAVSIDPPPLHRAILNKDIKEVTQLLADPKICQEINTSDGRSPPLFWAVKLGHLEIINLLLQNGADIQQLNSRDHHCLYFAVQGGHLDVLDQLFTRAPGLLTRYTVLMWIRLVEFAFTYGTSYTLIRIAKHILSTKDEKSLYTLMILLYCKGCRSLSFNTLKFKQHVLAMIDQDKKIDFIHYLMRGDKTLTLDLFSSQKIREKLVNWRSEEKSTIIQVASQTNREDILEKIFSFYPDLFFQTDPSCHTTYTFVQLVRDGHLSVLKNIFSKYPLLFSSPIDGEGRTNAILAAGYGHKNILEYIRENNRAQLFQFDQAWVTPLINAVGVGRFDIVKWFYEKEKDHFEKWRDPFGRCVGHFIARHADDKREILNFLASNSPDLLDVCNDEGYSPFYEILKGKKLDVLKWFLEKKPGLAKSWTNVERGTNFLHHVAGYGALEFLEYLYDTCQIPKELFFKCDKEGKTPIVYALNYKHLNILEWFRRNLPDAFEWKEAHLEIINNKLIKTELNLLIHVLFREKGLWRNENEEDIDIFLFFLRNYPSFFGSFLVKLIDSDKHTPDGKDFKISLIKVKHEMFLHISPNIPNPGFVEFKAELLSHPVLEDRLLPTPGHFSGILDAKVLPPALTYEILSKSNLFSLLQHGPSLQRIFGGIYFTNNMRNFYSLFSLPPYNVSTFTDSCRQTINTYVAFYLLLKGISYQLQCLWESSALRIIMDYCAESANARIADITLWELSDKSKESQIMSAMPDIEKYFGDLSLNVHSEMSPDDLKEYQKASAKKIVELAALAWTRAYGPVSESYINTETASLHETYKAQQMPTPAPWCYPLMAQGLFKCWEKSMISATTPTPSSSV